MIANVESLNEQHMQHVSALRARLTAEAQHERAAYAKAQVSSVRARRRKGRRRGVMLAFVSFVSFVSG